MFADSKVIARDLMEYGHSAVNIFDANRELIFCNNIFYDLFNISDKFNMGFSLQDVLLSIKNSGCMFINNDFAKYQEYCYKIFAETESLILEDNLLFLNDKVISIDVNRSSSGGMIFIYDNVTEKIKLSRECNSLRSVNEKILDNLSVAISIYGTDGRIKYYNVKHRELFGDIAKKTHINDILAIKDWKEIAREIMISTNARKRYESNIKYHNNYLRILSEPLPNGDIMINYSKV